MPFTKAEKQNIQEVVGGFCQEGPVGCQSNQPKVIYRIRRYDVTLFQITPSLVKNHKRVEIPFAKLRFDPKDSEWTLFSLQTKGQWMQYPTLLQHCNLETAVGEIRNDPLYLFCG